MKFYIVLALAAASAHAQLAVVGGQVYNSANEENLNGVTLILTSATNASTPLRFVTENRGLFLFEGLTPGRYLLFAECPGFARQAFGSLGNPLAGMTLTLAPGQQMNDIAFALTPGSSITGKVLDADGAAVVGAVVYALQPIYERGKKEYFPVANAAADDGGEYKLPDLGAGKVSAGGHVTQRRGHVFPRSHGCCDRSGTSGRRRGRGNGEGYSVAQGIGDARFGRLR